MKDFQVIHQRYGDRLYRYAVFLTHDKGEAEDLVQETYCHAIKHTGQFHRKSSVYTWLCAIMRNCYLDGKRKVGKSPVCYGDEGLADKIYLIDDAEQRIDIRDALQQLPKEYRYVFYRHYIEGLTFKEIAEESQKSESWARVVAFRAREQLKQYLEVT